MKIGFYLERYTDVQFRKESTLIINSLRKLSKTVKVFCNYAESDVINKLKPIIANKKITNDYLFWKNQDITHLIVYSWLSIRYTKLIKAASKAGIKIYLKMDSDGSLLYPDKPTFMKARGLNNSVKQKLIYILRLFQWSIIPKIISKIRIQQIELSDGIFIESPLAKKILSKSLKHWSKENLIKKITIIENPIEWEAQMHYKENVVLCIGRWDYKQKNAKTLIAVLNQLKTTWSVKIIGAYAQKVASQIKNINLEVSAENDVKHSEILKIIANSKIIFMPSLWEGFPLSACEGVTAGCSIVGGPLPSLVHLTSKNNGTIANDFKTNSLLHALERDIERWENGYYDAEKIATEWRAILNPEVVVNKMLNVMRSDNK